MFCWVGRLRKAYGGHTIINCIFEASRSGPVCSPLVSGALNEAKHQLKYKVFHYEKLAEKPMSASSGAAQCLIFLGEIFAYCFMDIFH